MFVYDASAYGRADAMLAPGERVCDIVRATGIPRSTINRWRRRGAPGARWAETRQWRIRNEAAYAYLLGLYLGDGHIANMRRPFLRLFLDDRYPQVVAEATACLQRVFAVPVGAYRYAARGRLMILQVSTPALLTAFPQHGPGRKHLRPIALEPWQRAITHAHPRMLIRGLIHSDGCRSVNRFSTRLPSGRVAQYAYARYFFSNLSEDIKDIFGEHCGLLGIRYSRASPRYVSVHDRRSVALLDGFVGPKG